MVLQRRYKCFYKTGSVERQHAAAQGYAGQVCLIQSCLRHVHITKDPASRPPLYHLNFLYIILSVGIPNWSGILQLGGGGGGGGVQQPYMLFLLGWGGIEIPSKKSKRLDINSFFFIFSHLI